MEAYRDQYATLFKNGRHVVVLGISIDPDSTLINWARESDFPILFVSDADASISKRYEVYQPTSNTDKRHVYVIGPDGHITFKMQPFNVLSQDDYSRLGAEVERLAAPRKEGS